MSSFESNAGGDLRQVVRKTFVEFEYAGSRESPLMRSRLRSASDSALDQLGSDRCSGSSSPESPRSSGADTLGDPPLKARQRLSSPAGCDASDATDLPCHEVGLRCPSSAEEGSDSGRSVELAPEAHDGVTGATSAFRGHGTPAHAVWQVSGGGMPHFTLVGLPDLPYGVPQYLPQCETPADFSSAVRAPLPHAPPGNWAAVPAAAGAGACSGEAWESSVPGEAEAPLEEEDESTFTTVMMRNLPNNYSRHMLLELLDSEGFTACYNFIYLPIDFNSRASFAYAFINFVCSEDAARFRRHFDGFSKWAFPSEKVCQVDWSRPHQGLSAHVERYRNSPVMHESVDDECKPAMFENGMRAAFPPPVKRIKAPRIRRYGWKNN